MSYALLLSTTSSLNLKDLNDDLITFDSNLWELNQEKFLNYSNQWLVLSQDGCSNDFRYVSEELGFGLPKEWYPEDEVSILATIKLIKIIRKLVQSGEKVDCVNAWLGDDQENINSIEQLNVDLKHLSNEEFRFHGFKRYTFLLKYIN